MMRVLHVMKAVGIAGAERHVLMLLPALRAHGVDARLVLIAERQRPLDDYISALTEQGVPVERQWIQRHFSARLMPDLVRSIRESQAQLVHTHLPHAHLYGIPAAHIAGVPVISSHHNDDPFVRRFPFRPLFRYLWRTAHAEIAISQAVAAYCQEIEGEASERVHVIPYGIPLASTPPDRKAARAQLLSLSGIVDPDPCLIGIVCRLTEQKGVHFGLRAFAKIAAQFPHAALVIIGDGALRAALEAEAEQLGLKGRAHFVGWQPNAASLMAGLDIFLLPSLWEGFGLVFLEAMAASVPIVASRVSAIPEVVIDGGTGLLTPPGDVDKMADALAALVSDAPLRHHMGMLGLERLEMQFTLQTMIDKTLDLYQQVVG